MMLVYSTSLSVLGKSGYQNAALLLAAALNILSCLSTRVSISEGDPLFPRGHWSSQSAVGHLMTSLLTFAERQPGAK